MNMNEWMLCDPHDHIMANTWRLIFERQSRPAANNSSPQPITDFTELEQLLLQYRLIGLTLADYNNSQRRSN